jgi:glycosyltransferase involved in cell wall biosynthesis
MIFISDAPHWFDEIVNTQIRHPQDVPFSEYENGTAIIALEKPGLLSEAFKYMPKLQLAVAWNTEQFSRTDKLHEFVDACQSILSVLPEGVKLEIWDYSEWNVVQLRKKLGREDITLRVQKTTSEQDVCALRVLLETTPKEYDFVCIGSPSPHRTEVIEQVRAVGMTVLHLNGVRGLVRDTCVASAKQLLNIHYSPEYQVFESVRCNRWIEAGMTVVTEPCVNPEALTKVFNNMDFFRAEKNIVMKRKMSICLVMIVKNEEDVIRRSLSSILPFVDTWCIVDTGSTDSTMTKIKEIAEEFGVPGTLYERVWKNFGHNRSEALELSKSLADWSMMFDADDILKGFEGKNRENRPVFSATVDGYCVTIKRGTITHYRYVFFNNTYPWNYIGVVHEYANYPGMGGQKRIVLDELYIDARTEGARSKDEDKYKHDAELLEGYLEEYPTDERSMFYAAQSWRDYGHVEKAYYWYSKSADTITAWHQERYISLYNMIKLTDSLDKKFELAWRALSICPTRLEATHEVLRYTRSKDLWSIQAYALAYVSNKEAVKTIDPGFLFFEDIVHTCLFYDEFAIHCYYLGKFEECVEHAFTALQHAPSEQKDRMKTNYELAKLKS